MKESAKEELSLKDVVGKARQWGHYLKTQWIKILVIGIVGGAIGYFNSELKKTEYKAVVRFTIESEQSGGGLSGAMGLASKFGIDVGSGGGGAFTGKNLIELMKSRMLMQKTLLRSVKVDNKDITLANYFIDMMGWRAKWKEKPGTTDIDFRPNMNMDSLTIEQNSILGSIYSALHGGILKIEQKDPETSIINIEVTSRDEKFSKYLADIITEEISAFYIETKTKKSTANVLILQRQVDSLKSELNQSLSDVASSIDNTFNLNPALNIKKVPSSRRQIDVQGNGAIYTELVKNLEIAKMTLRNETPLIQVVDRPILPLSPLVSNPWRSFMVGFVFAGFIAAGFLMVKKWLSFALK